MKAREIVRMGAVVGRVVRGRVDMGMCSVHSFLLIALRRVRIGVVFWLVEKAVWADVEGQIPRIRMTVGSSMVA